MSVLVMLPESYAKVLHLGVAASTSPCLSHHSNPPDMVSVQRMSI